MTTLPDSNYVRPHHHCDQKMHITDGAEALSIRELARRCAIPAFTFIAISIPDKAPAEAPETCIATRAQEFVGKPFSKELAEKARLAAGARTVRGVGADTPSSSDARSDRLNLHKDENGIIINVRCG